jgi:hypothetical protein
MFCKVCRDAGCSEEKYTSHYVRSSGQVVCPTLLNQACRICKHTGHTSSYCPDRKPRDHRDDRYQREEPRRDDRYQREEPRRDDRYQREREEPRRDDRYQREREEPRRDDRYQREEPRRDDRYQREEPCTQAEVQHASIAIDIRKVDLHHAAMWGDEDNKPFVCPIEPLFVCDPEEMCREFISSQQAEAEVEAEDLGHCQW